MPKKKKALRKGKNKKPQDKSDNVVTKCATHRSQPVGAEYGDIAVGDVVKKSFAGGVMPGDPRYTNEGMWLLVDEVRQDRVIGILDNHPVLIFDPPLKSGDIVEARYDEITAIQEGKALLKGETRKPPTAQDAAYERFSQTMITVLVCTACRDERYPHLNQEIAPGVWVSALPREHDEEHEGHSHKPVTLGLVPSPYEDDQNLRCKHITDECYEQFERDAGA